MILMWKKKKSTCLDSNNNIINSKTDIALLKQIIETVNKSPTLSVQMVTTDGTVLNIRDTKYDRQPDTSMLGW